MPSHAAQAGLSPQDTYALARALVGLDWQDLPLGPVGRLLLSALDLNLPEDVQALRRVLGPEVLRAILAIDTNGPPPEPHPRTGDINLMPDLPPEAQLTSEQQRQADQVGHWVRDYVAWAGGAANEMSLFHEAAAL